ncbi:GntR family transcriptional regulator [Rhodococcus sp. CH91]|uniref:GntR family transcriptional regulator n=1 Tax=Rhodococcus sp. CH91 TaxID=2910256 RepID=UPI001F4A2580|nr:GntR family transcriptional regulator [Rhodococcus sp. CH91]
MSTVVREARTLKHQVVRRQVECLLDQLTVGDHVPSERELATRFDVARETVRQALRELLVDGRIERRGRSTVVAGPKIVQPLVIGSYTEAALLEGRSAGRVLVAWTELVADDELAAHLGLETGDPVLELERILLTDEVRVGLERTRLPARRFPDLRRTLDPASSLYAAIRDRGITFARAVERIETTLPDAREAALLDADTRTPMLLLDRISYDENDVPIEHRRSLYRGDRMSFVTTVTA